MIENKYFLHQIKHTRNAFDKGIVVKETFDAAKQSYHAYLGAYGYGNDADTDFVSCMITDMWGSVVNGMSETWNKPEPEGEPEE